MQELTKFRIKDGIAYIDMDDGKVNAMSEAMLRALRLDLARAASAGAPVVLSGREGVFSAGFDLAVFKQGREAQARMLGAGIDLILDMLSFPYPVMTVCTGHAYPMGAFLMLSADLRFAVAGDFRIGLNEVAIGIPLPQFAVELARHRLAPQAVARISTGTMFGPDEAAAYGYVDCVADQQSLAEKVLASAIMLRDLDNAAYRATKARLNAPVIAAIKAAGLPTIPERAA